MKIHMRENLWGLIGSITYLADKRGIRDIKRCSWISHEVFSIRRNHAEVRWMFASLEIKREMRSMESLMVFFRELSYGLLVILICLGFIHGHGRMEEPPARNAAWRYGIYSFEKLFLAYIASFVRLCCSCALWWCRIKLWWIRSAEIQWYEWKKYVLKIQFEI